MANLKMFAGAKVLVTGAGGSIGSEICRALVHLGVYELRMVGHSEAPLYAIRQELTTEYNAVTHAPQYKAGNTYLLPILASVADEYAMKRALQGVDIVIHAAAHKHVPLCEENPLEAIINNIGGTMTLASTAARHGVKHFVLISTDKAVKPTSVMGMTKRACELYLQYLRNRVDMKLTTVRFGNVLNSSGSVLPLWREQLKAGKPITLTDKRCTRYFMSIPEAVNLTLMAATLPDAQGTFVLDMGEPKNLYEMARTVIMEHQVDTKGSYDWDQTPYITETGLRPGEKLHEELATGPVDVTEIPRVLRVVEPERALPSWEIQDVVLAAKAGTKSCALAALRKLCE